MKVALLFFTDPRRNFSSSVAALAAVVRDAGHEPVALEIFRGYGIDDVVAHLNTSDYDVIGASCMTRDWPGAHALFARIESSAYVVVGGYHASLAPNEVAECDGVDAIVIGEGEGPMRAILDALQEGRRPRTQDGLWCRQENFEGPPPVAAAEPDIETLPHWDYDVFGEMQSILREGINTFGPLVDGFLPVRAGRGCPFSCAYCSAPRWGALNGFAKATRNTRDVESLCAELASLRDRYSVEGFEFWDEHFPMQLPWLEAFAACYASEVGMPFKVEMHPNAATRRRLELLKQAGCVLFHCGIEAGDEAFRIETLNRRTPDARLQQVFDDCRELGLETSASLMTMLPGETREQQAKTTALLHRLRPGSFMWSNYHPLPGTPLGRRAVSHWPGPARKTFADYDQVHTKTPPVVNAEERAATFAELGSLQRELVQIASARAGRDARPVEVPEPLRPMNTALRELLHLSDDVIARSALDYASDASRRVLRVELEHPDFGESLVRIAPLNQAHFVASSDVGLAYAGKEASPALLRWLEASAKALHGLTFDQLAAAHESRSRVPR